MSLDEQSLASKTIRVYTPYHIRKLALHNLNIVHYNVFSLMAEGRLDFLSKECNKMHVDVLCLSESKLDDTIPDNLIQLAGYHEPIRHDRNRRGGGTVVYIASHLPFKQINNLQSDHFEHLWIDVFCHIWVVGIVRLMIGEL